MRVPVWHSIAELPGSDGMKLLPALVIAGLPRLMVWLLRHAERAEPAEREPCRARFGSGLVSAGCYVADTLDAAGGGECDGEDCRSGESGSGALHG
jgi:hypothetical protein